MPQHPFLGHFGESGGGSFVPNQASMPNLKLWIDASQEIIYLNDDVAQTLTDFSGNGRLFEASAGFEGTFKTGIQNGNPAFLLTQPDFYFDHFGVTNVKLYYSCLHFGAGGTVLIVFKGTEANPQRAFYLFDNSVAGKRGAGLYMSDAGATENRFNFIVRNFANTVSVSFLENTYIPQQAQLVEGNYKNDGGANDSNLFADGMLIDSGATTVNPEEESSSGLAAIGSKSDGSNFGFTGYIFEVLIYDAVLTAAQRSDLNGYLSQKWGLGL